jgi:hypothetical protein
MLCRFVGEIERGISLAELPVCDIATQDLDSVEILHLRPNPHTVLVHDLPIEQWAHQIRHRIRHS